jgi:RNA polymerase sigma-70 factor (ECF subfamily)
VHVAASHIVTPPASKPFSGESDAALVARARSGDASAFEAVASRHVKAVLGLVRQQIGDEHAAEDATQQALILAYRSLHQLDEPERFAGWLYRIAVREAKRAVQKGAREVATARVPEQEAEIRASDAERSLAVREAVGSLEEPYQLVVTLKYLEGLDAAEIGKRLGVPHGTVRAQLSRALPLLREKLRRLL